MPDSTDVARTRAADLVVMAYVQGRQWSEAIKAVDKLGASQEMKNRLVGACIDAREAHMAIEAVKLAGRQFTDTEGTQVIGICIEDGHPGDVVIVAERGVRRKLTPDEINRLRRVCIEKGYLDSIDHVVDLSDGRELTPKEGDQLVEATIRGGCLDTVLKAAILIRRALTAQELEDFAMAIPVPDAE
jgi:hypothetical protein